METVFTPLSVTVIESSLLAGSSPSLEARSPFSVPVLGVPSSLSQHALGSTFEQVSGAS